MSLHHLDPRRAPFGPAEPWRKCPSVTAGGKPYFYIAASAPGVFWRIVWDRFVRAYALTHDAHDSTFGYYSTPRQAQRAVAERFERCSTI